MDARVNALALNYPDIFTDENVIELRLSLYEYEKLHAGHNHTHLIEALENNPTAWRTIIQKTLLSNVYANVMYDYYVSTQQLVKGEECPRCSNFSVFSREEQLRAGDEAASIVRTCYTTGCGFHTTR